MSQAWIRPIRSLSGLQDVDTTGLVGDEILQYNATSGLWEITQPTDFLDSVTFTVGSASVSRGDVVYLDDATDKVFLADASAIATSRMVGVIDDDTKVLDESASVKFEGVVLNATTGLTKGARVYLSTAGTSGSTLTQAPPQTSPETQTIVGLAISATDILVRVSEPIETS